MSDRKKKESPCLSRRELLLAGGAATLTTVVLTSFPGMAWAREVPAVVAKYPKRKVARLADLREGVCVEFKYPTDDPLYAASLLVKLGVPAGGGVGADKDVVAFNSLCPHVGGPMMGTYQHKYRALGPCPFHLTTFDLTKHGMVIAGHATESLPQVVLEVEGGDVYATGVMGLIFGTFDSFQGGTA